MVAPGVAADQHLVVVRVPDREARRAIVMRGAARRPAVAGLPPAEGLGDRTPPELYDLQTEPSGAVRQLRVATGRSYAPGLFGDPRLESSRK